MTVEPLTSVAERVKHEFPRQFSGSATLLARAPGRVNLIGEHTDYNDGFVMPVAIDRAVWIALRPRKDNRVVVHSLDLGETSSFQLGNWPPKRGRGWLEYIRGVAWVLSQEGHKLRGWEGVIAGDIPRGAGLSSSAAVEMAVARAFSSVSDIKWDPTAMALAGQRAENQWVGVNCGIMDQLISARGEAGRALLIDCRSLEVKAVPVPDQAAVVVLDTATRRGLVRSAYNERRSQCEEAARAFGVRALRDVSVEEFEAKSGGLDETTCRRARHVVHENERTVRAAAALDVGDLKEAGRLMNESHESLRADFEVSRDELDIIASLARDHGACYGARMTGAGFGGCAVALVEADQSREFADSVAGAYEGRTRLTPAIYVCRADEGASVAVIPQE